MALPTKGKDVGWTFAHEQTPRFEFAAIKVADLREGTCATVGNSGDGVIIPGWSPVRLELPQP